MEQTKKPHLILSVTPETSWSLKLLRNGTIRFVEVPTNQVWEINEEVLRELYEIGCNTYIQLDPDNDLVITITDLLNLNEQIRREYPTKANMWWDEAKATRRYRGNGAIIGNITREHFDLMFIAAEHALECMKILGAKVEEQEALDAALCVASEWMNDVVDDEGDPV